MSNLQQVAPELQILQGKISNCSTCPLWQPSDRSSNLVGYCPILELNTLSQDKPRTLCESVLNPVRGIEGASPQKNPEIDSTQAVQPDLGTKATYPPNSDEKPPENAIDVAFSHLISVLQAEAAQVGAPGVIAGHLEHYYKKDRLYYNYVGPNKDTGKVETKYLPRRQVEAVRAGIERGRRVEALEKTIAQVEAAWQACQGGQP